MSECGDLSFCELRAKEVIDAVDGRRLGRISDAVFSGCGGGIEGIVVPVTKRGFFFKPREVFIPWCCVKKIGEDVIIVELEGYYDRKDKKHGKPHCPPPCSPTCPPPQHEQPCPPPERPDCDGKCEKCMLFDCRFRWNGYMKPG